MRAKLSSIIGAFVLTVFSLNAYAQVIVDAVFAANDFTGATYNVPTSGFTSINSISITDGGTIAGYEISPGNTIAKFTGGSFHMTGGTVAHTNFFIHNNYANDSISSGTFGPGGVQFTNMQAGGSLDISGGVFPGSVTVAQYAGDVTVSGGPSIMAVPNPGPISTLTFIGSNWTFGGNPLAFVGNQADLTDIGFGSLQGTLDDGTPFQVTLGGTGFGVGFPVVTVVDPALPPNTPPTAVAGADQAIRAGDTVLLDGSASFDDNTATAALLYSWSFSVLPTGSSASIAGANTATPSFVADLADTYVVALIVTDEGGLASAADDVVVSADNLAPTAAAGSDQLVIIGTTVNLDGSASSDPEFDPLSYEWAINAAPAGSSSTLIGDDTAAASFVPDLEGGYQMNLDVSDPIGPGAPDAVQITATSVAGFAQFQIVSADDLVGDLNPGQVTTGGNQTAYLKHLSRAIVAIQEGDLGKAIKKLEDAIGRSDGCVLRGSPDGNGPGRDWITDCTAQTEVYASLGAALAALQP